MRSAAGGPALIPVAMAAGPPDRCYAMLDAARNQESNSVRTLSLSARPSPRRLTGYSSPVRSLRHTVSWFVHAMPVTSLNEMHFATRARHDRTASVVDFNVMIGPDMAR